MIEKFELYLMLKSDYVTITISCHKEVYWNQSFKHFFWSLNSLNLKSIIKLIKISWSLFRIFNVCIEFFQLLKRLML